MLRWFQALMPREDKFFDYFVAQARQGELASISLRGVLEGGPKAGEFVADVVRLEHEADEICRQLLLAVRRSFITPFDRSDISALASALDDVIDQMQRTTKKIGLFDVTAFEPMMRQMGDVIVEAAKLSTGMVTKLATMRESQAEISAMSVEMTRLEEKCDELHDLGVKELFQAHRHDDPMAFIVGAEIYDHLEKTMDRLEDVARQIGDIVIENI